MVILLDTHILVWAWTDDPRLKNHHRKLVASPDQKVVVSSVSIWELSIK
jgi:PIN domain nuclease of toxin-antitoxin system